MQSINWEFDPVVGLRVPTINFEDDTALRHSLARYATVQSFAVLQLLQREQERDDDMFGQTFTVMLQRLFALNDALLDTVGEGTGLVSTSEIADKLFGPGEWKDAGTVAGGVSEPAPSVSGETVLLADPARAAIVASAADALYEQVRTMNAALIFDGGAASHTEHSVWNASYNLLLARVSAIYSAALEDDAGVEEIAEHLASTEALKEPTIAELSRDLVARNEQSRRRARSKKQAGEVTS